MVATFHVESEPRSFVKEQSVPLIAELFLNLSALFFKSLSLWRGWLVNECQASACPYAPELDLEISHAGLSHGCRGSKLRASCCVVVAFTSEPSAQLLVFLLEF